MDRQNPSSQHSALPQSAISLMDWRTDGWIDISVSFAIHNPRSRNPQFTKFLSFSTTIFHSNYLNKDKESQRQTGRPERRCQPSTPPLSMRLAIRRWIKKKEIEKGKKKGKKKSPNKVDFVFMLKRRAELRIIGIVGRLSTFDVHSKCSNSLFPSMCNWTDQSISRQNVNSVNKTVSLVTFFFLNKILN